MVATRSRKRRGGKGRKGAKKGVDSKTPLEKAMVSEGEVTTTKGQEKMEVRDKQEERKDGFDEIYKFRRNSVRMAVLKIKMTAKNNEEKKKAKKNAEIVKKLVSGESETCDEDEHVVNVVERTPFRLPERLLIGMGYGSLQGGGGKDSGMNDMSSGCRGRMKNESVDTNPSGTASASVIVPPLVVEDLLKIKEAECEKLKEENYVLRSNLQELGQLRQQNAMLNDQLSALQNEIRAFNGTRLLLSVPGQWVVSQDGIKLQESYFDSSAIEDGESQV